MIDLSQQPEKAVLVSVDTGVEDCDALLDELEQLATTAGAVVVGRTIQKREKPDSATFVGSGRLDEICEFSKSNDVDLLIFDDELSPTQQRNIENRTGIRTIDRTLLILDIFALNARSDEGRVQIDLARYRYQLPRLSGQGTDLSRQGGIGNRRGAGESKLETDKRHIRRRIHSLEIRLEEMQKRRDLQRKRQMKNGVTSVAIVGYTNAGKSTLMNLLTDAGVLAEDKLFATLDPTARKLKLPNGRDVMLIDTVGLIRKLPHQLIEAFKSTLEVAADSDIILNICDASGRETDEHIKVTENILKELGCVNRPVITVYNKCDLVSNLPMTPKNTVCISAKTGEGIEKLLEEIQKSLPEDLVRIKVMLPFSMGKVANEIRENGQVHSERYVAEGIYLDCTVSAFMADRLVNYKI